MHRCFPLAEAYRMRLGHLQSLYHAPLVSKKEQLMLQLLQVQDRLEEVTLSTCERTIFT